MSIVDVDDTGHITFILHVYGLQARQLPSTISFFSWFSFYHFVYQSVCFVCIVFSMNDINRVAHVRSKTKSCSSQLDRKQETLQKKKTELNLKFLNNYF